MWKRWGACGLLAMLCAGIAAAAEVPAGLQRQVEAARKRAARHIEARKWTDAFSEIDAARKQVRDASLRAQRRTAGQQDPQLQKERAELRRWLEREQSRRKPTERETLLREYQQRVADLERKYARQNARTSETSHERRRRTVAPYQILTSTLDETSADLHAARKEKGDALYYRQRALATRLEAYQALGQREQARQAAARLLRLSPENPDAYRHAALFHQESHDFDHAVGLWQQGIRLLEENRAQFAGSRRRGVSAGARNALLVEFYRQLAFCRQQQGQKAAADQAMEKASRLEQAQKPASSR